jgi:hypothetical protein
MPPRRPRVQWATARRPRAIRTAPTASCSSPRMLASRFLERSARTVGAESGRHNFLAPVGFDHVLRAFAVDAEAAVFANDGLWREPAACDVSSRRRFLKMSGLTQSSNGRENMTPSRRPSLTAAPRIASTRSLGFETPPVFHYFRIAQIFAQSRRQTNSAFNR